MITDVADERLANLLQANFAPGLNAVDPADTQRAWVQDWTVPPAVMTGQFPVLEFVPTFTNFIPRHLNTNYDFSPVMDLQIIRRTGLPPYVIINTPKAVLAHLPPGLGFTPVGSPVRINASPFLFTFTVPNPLQPIQ